jgi:ribosomal-protein-alanine N-acetyltransferase
MDLRVDVLGTGVVRVRRFTPADAPSVARHANNPKIGVNLRDGFPYPYRVEDAQAFIGNLPEDLNVFAVEVDGEAAGCIGFTFGTNIHRFVAEVGYWLGEAHWGKGIATAVLASATGAMFANHELHRIHADPFAWNAASIRVLEKAGYVFEGRKRCSAFKEGKVADQVLYAKIRKPEE